MMKFLFGIVIGYIVGAIVVLYAHSIKKIEPKEMLMAGHNTTDTTFVPCRENVYELIKEAGIKFPEIVIRQAILETGHFTSKGCIERHNLFGFYNGKRYLTFETYQECVNFYKSWQTKKYGGGDYYLFLKTLPYAQDTSYTQTLKKIK